MRQKKLLYSAILLLFCVNIANAQIKNTHLVIQYGIADNVLKQKIEQNVSSFLTTFNIAAADNKTPSFDKNATTQDLRTRFSALWKTSPMICTDAVLNLDILTRPAGGYQIRNIGVDMLGAAEKDRKQKIVLNLTSDGKIDDVFIPLRDYDELKKTKKEVENEDIRFMVLDFVENFRTAYNRKDIDFLEKVFSQYAVIIVGKKLKLKNNNELQPVSTSEKWIMSVQNKEQYITGLKGVFSRNKYIDVQFDNIKVTQHNKNKCIYGVTLKQDWTNMNVLKQKTYADTGYVFLMINYCNTEKPEIVVRTWQPDKDIESEKEIFKLGDFPIE